jgi:hypothetical protein
MGVKWCLSLVVRRCLRSILKRNASSKVERKELIAIKHFRSTVNFTSTLINYKIYNYCIKMKQLEKIVGISSNDVKIAVPALKEAYTRMYRDYNEKTHPKLKMLDGLILLSLLTFIIQLLYA